MKRKIKGIILYLIFCLAVFCIFASLINDDVCIAKEYTVQPGDTYDILAYRFGVEEDLCVWRERIKMYNGKEDSCLYIGETIYILIKGDRDVLR